MKTWLIYKEIHLHDFLKWRIIHIQCIVAFISVYVCGLHQYHQTQTMNVFDKKTNSHCDKENHNEIKTQKNLPFN